MHKCSWPLSCHHQGCCQLPQPHSACPFRPPARTGDCRPQKACWLRWQNLSQPPRSLPASENTCLPHPSLPPSLPRTSCPVPAGALPSHWAPGQEGKSASIRKGKCVCTAGGGGWFGGRKWEIERWQQDLGSAAPGAKPTHDSERKPVVSGLMRKLRQRQPELKGTL